MKIFWEIFLELKDFTLEIPFNIYRALGNVYSLERRYFFGDRLSLIIINERLRLTVNSNYFAIVITVYY